MAEVLLRITTGFWASKALFAAAELGVADAIHQHGGPATAEEITTALSGSDPRAMFRVLRFLASMGVFDMQLEGSPDDIAYHKTYRFSLNATSQLLRSDVENSMRASVRLEAGPLHYGVWANFLDAAKTGRSVTKAVLGTEMWDYYESHPQEQAIFNAAMTNITAKEVADVLSGYDFAGVTSLVDIGGGLGSLLFGILRRYPTIKKGHLFDLPSVVKNVVVPEDLVDRVEVHGGSFLDGDAAGIPAGADAYIMKHIIHDWDDEHSERILQATRKAMPAHAKVLLAEYVVPIGPEPCLAKALDLHMMTLLSAKERTRAEFAALFRSVGLELTRVTGVEGGINVVEAHLASA